MCMRHVVIPSVSGLQRKSIVPSLRNPELADLPWRHERQIKNLVSIQSKSAIRRTRAISLLEERLVQ